MLVKSLVALATEKMLLKTSGKTFLKGIAFMYAAGLAPERLSVMMTSSQKYILQFHSKCDIRPFAANYPSFARVLRGIVHVRAWRIKSIEFVNVAFDIKDVENLERTIDKLGVELVLLRNCTYPHVDQGEQAIKLLNALNRKKLAVVCEYGDERLKHKIVKRRERHAQDRSTDVNAQEVAGQNVDGEGMRVMANALRRRNPYSLRRRNQQRQDDNAFLQAIRQILDYDAENAPPRWPYPSPAVVAAAARGNRDPGTVRFPRMAQRAEMVGEPVEPAEEVPDDVAPHDIDMDDAIDRPPQFYRVGDEPMGDDGEEVKEEDDDEL